MVDDRAEMARRCGLSRARVTQVMSLLRLPDEIQKYVMALLAQEQRLCSGRRFPQIVALVSDATQQKGFQSSALIVGNHQRQE